MPGLGRAPDRAPRPRPAPPVGRTRAARPLAQRHLRFLSERLVPKECISERFAPIERYNRRVTEQGNRRLRGRQAEAERNDRLVLEAAREVFATQGGSAPVSAVAERAGVGMGSLYRRYGSKTELLQYLCILAMEQTIGAARAALACDDAWTGLEGYVRDCVSFGSGALAPLGGTIPTTPRMWEISKLGRRLLDELVTRARREGGLRADVTALDVAWLIALFGQRGPAPPAGPAAPSRARRVPSATGPWRGRRSGSGAGGGLGRSARALASSARCAGCGPGRACPAGSGRGGAGARRRPAGC